MPGVGGDKSFNAGAAAAYDRFTGLWSQAFRERLLAAARVSAGQTVLEVSAGTGVLAEAAAALVGPAGRVIATDISLSMLEVAQRKLAGLPARVIAMDGQELACRAATCDAVICQLGLMYLPDPARGLREFRRVLRPHGRLAAQVWSVPARVQYLGFLADALSRHNPAQRDAIYSPTNLSEPARLETLLTAAGFCDVSVAAETRELAFSSFDAYWGGVEAGAGKLGQFYVELSDAARSLVREEVARRMAGLEVGGRLVLRSEALIGTGVA
jgi:ubiquinone/menaquinone biosynthesis C-methylase UbiE